jgi:arylsulfatase A-like enzyme
LASSPSARAAFDIDREPTRLRDRYGRHRHGQSMLLARRLVEAGARLVTVYWGSEPQDWADGKGPRPANNPWDTHRNHFPLCRDSLLPRADQAYSALIDDLSERGLLAETLVVWTGEFGRTPRISRPWASRDHWPHAFTALLAGGGVRGGAVYGRTDRWAAEVEEQPVSPADLMATLFSALGVRPEQQLAGRLGERHQLSEGRVVGEWFGS